MNSNFYSHASREARRISLKIRPVSGHFYSHASREARRFSMSAGAALITISTHTPLARRDIIVLLTSSARLFLLTRLSRGATLLVLFHFPEVHFYSHASREARRSSQWMNRANVKISTHTPLARRDINSSVFNPAKMQYFYSHASREARRNGETEFDFKRRFLLTRLSRGATSGGDSGGSVITFLLTRLSRGATSATGY